MGGVCWILFRLGLELISVEKEMEDPGVQKSGSRESCEEQGDLRVTGVDSSVNHSAASVREIGGVPGVLLCEDATNLVEAVSCVPTSSRALRNSDWMREKAPELTHSRYRSHLQPLQRSRRQKNSISWQGPVGKRGWSVPCVRDNEWLIKI